MPIFTLLHTCKKISRWYGKYCYHFLSVALPSIPDLLQAQVSLETQETKKRRRRRERRRLEEKNDEEKETEEEEENEQREERKEEKRRGRRREKRRHFQIFSAIRIPSPTQFWYAFVITLAIHLEQEIRIVLKQGPIIVLSISQSV